MNKTGLIAKISIKYVLPTCIREKFLADFAVFRVFLGISRNFAGPRPREISEASILETSSVVSGVRASCNIKQVSFFSFPCQNNQTNLTVLFQNRCFIIP